MQLSLWYHSVHFQNALAITFKTLHSSALSTTTIWSVPFCMYGSGHRVPVCGVMVWRVVLKLPPHIREYRVVPMLMFCSSRDETRALRLHWMSYIAYDVCVFLYTSCNRGARNRHVLCSLCAKVNDSIGETAFTAKLEIRGTFIIVVAVEVWTLSWCQQYFIIVANHMYCVCACANPEYIGVFFIDSLQLGMHC